MRGLNNPRELICRRARIENVRLHDCRHSFASRALALGEGLPMMIGRLLGHTQVETTARYAHLARDSVRGSAVRVSDSIAADILGDYPTGGLVEAPASPQGDRFWGFDAAARLKWRRQSSFQAAGVRGPRRASFVGSRRARLRARRRRRARVSGPWAWRCHGRSSFLVPSRAEGRQCARAPWARAACGQRAGEHGALRREERVAGCGRFAVARRASLWAAGGQPRPTRGARAALRARGSPGRGAARGARAHRHQAALSGGCPPGRDPPDTAVSPHTGCPACP